MLRGAGCCVVHGPWLRWSPLAEAAFNVAQAYGISECSAGMPLDGSRMRFGCPVACWPPLTRRSIIRRETEWGRLSGNGKSWGGRKPGSYKVDPGKVRGLAARGLNRTDIARALGCHRRTVARMLAVAG